MNKIVGVIDEPVSRGSSDNLDINVHSNSLIKFIHQTSSPITIGIQGEWGSGKTSLINTIHYAFEQDQIFKQIWINAWEQEESKEVFEREFVIAQETEDFDEEWEKVLFRICYTRQRLKPRVTDISKFFSYIKDELLKDNEDNIGDIVASILSQTSVTSVTSTDQGQQAELPTREKGSYKRVWLIDWDSLKRSLQNQGMGEEGPDFTEQFINEIK